MSTKLGRTFAIENLPDASDWHSLASLAFFAYVGREHYRLSQLRLTIDTAHLPPLTTDPIHSGLDGSGLTRLKSRLSDAGLSLPSAFFDDIKIRLSQLPEMLPAGHTTADLQESPFGSTVTALVLAGDRTSEIHLNDPITDGLPILEGHDQRPLLRTVLDLAEAYGADIVLEPSGVDARELISYTNRFESMCSDTYH